MKKKLTLNQTWTLCLRQWKWIIEQLDKGSDETNENSVVLLKLKWAKQNGYENKISAACFFCEYVSRRGLDCATKECPGQLVSQQFQCENSSYAYYSKPRKFYKKLLELNEKRKKEQK